MLKNSFKIGFRWKMCVAMIIFIGCKSSSTHTNEVNKRSPEAELPIIQLKEDQVNKLKTGQKAYVEAFQNTSTGADWNMTHEPDSTLFKLVDTDYTSESNDPQIVGAGGVIRWNYTALRSGKDSLVMWYGRSWEARRPEDKPVRYFIEVTNE
jgi:predicted secreted protein